MTDWLTITGVPPWDGRYEFDIADRELTTREWGWLKRLAGYMPLTIQDGFDGADPELFAVFAVIALHRNGKIQAADVADTYDRFADAPFGMTILLESDDAEEEEPAPLGNSPASAPTSGDDSPTSSETLDGSQSPSGTPASAISEWPLARSGN